LLHGKIFSNLNDKYRHSYIHVIRSLELSDGAAVQFVKSTRFVTKFFRFKSVRLPCLEVTETINVPKTETVVSTPVVEATKNENM
jgi:hypothetical protein